MADEKLRAHDENEPENRHYWRVTFTLGEFQQAKIMVDTIERDFAVAQAAALKQHEQLHQQWPGPVEIAAIEYLSER